MQIEENKYTRITFVHEHNKPLITFGDDIITRKWIHRSSHGYVIEKRNGYTIIEFILDPYKKEDMADYCNRVINHAINLYEAYETNKDANIDYYINLR
jgi:hypothetical protein